MKTLKFELDEKETQLAYEFMKNHSKTCLLKDKYQGAIGIGYTFTFTDSSIGQIAHVECFCKEKKFLSMDL